MPGPSPPVSRLDVFLRGIRNLCPNCGRSSLFNHGFTLHKTCPGCGLKFERGEGFFLGSMSINYGVTIVVCLMSILVLGLTGFIASDWAIGMAVASSLLFPVAFYRSSRSWWLMAFFWFLPHELPANRRRLAADEDENV